MNSARKAADDTININVLQHRIPLYNPPGLGRDPQLPHSRWMWGWVCEREQNVSPGRIHEWPWWLCYGPWGEQRRHWCGLSGGGTALHTPNHVSYEVWMGTPFISVCMCRCACVCVHVWCVCVCVHVWCVCVCVCVCGCVCVCVCNIGIRGKGRRDRLKPHKEVYVWESRYLRIAVTQYLHLCSCHFNLLPCMRALHHITSDLHWATQAGTGTEGGGERWRGRGKGEGKGGGALLTRVTHVYTKCKKPLDELFGFGNESLGTRLGPQVHSHVELFTWYNHLQATERGAIIHINEHQILLFTDRLHPALQRKRTFVN